MKSVLKRDEIGIYVHIPFCKNKCKYCSFISGNYDSKIQEKYFKMLQKEIESSEFSNKIIKTIYFGGGTPSVVDEKYLIKTLSTIKNKFQLCCDVEISIECNPNSVEKEKLCALQKNGFSRISFGAQNFCDDVLIRLGRQHNSKQIFKAVELADEVGFVNIGIDYMLGVKKIDRSIFIKSIEKLKRTGLKHISVYLLMLEKGTSLYDEMQKKLFIPLNDEDCIDDYNFVVETLKEFGFEQYEISNFALKSFQCKHNLNYWDCGEFIGFGVSAHGYVDGLRIENTDNILKYIHQNELELRKNSSINNLEALDNIQTYFNKLRKIKKLTQKQKIEEYIMLSLRTNKGLLFSRLKNLGYDLINEKQKQIDFLKNNNLVSITKNELKINSKFFSISNSIILELIP